MTKKNHDDAVTDEQIARLLAGIRESRHRSITELYQRARQGEENLDLAAFGLYFLERIPADLSRRVAEEIERTGEIPPELKMAWEEALGEWRENPS